VDTKGLPAHLSSSQHTASPAFGCADNGLRRGSQWQNDRHVFLYTFDSRDCSLNFFGVDASQPLSVWRKKGWIHPDDPRGWFQWYCRYYMGRRMPDEDARQIKR